MSSRTVAVPTAASRTTATRIEAVHSDIPVSSFPLTENLYGSPLVTTAFTRAAPDAYTNWNGTYYAETTNIPRFESDSTPLGLLIEGSRTNSLLHSRDFSNAVWVEAGTPTSSQDQTGFDGAENTAWTLGDDNGAGYEWFQQVVTIPNDSNRHYVGFMIKKDSDTSRFPMLRVALLGGTPTGNHDVMINTSTGANQWVNTESPDYGVIDRGNFWLLYSSIDNNSTGNTSLVVEFFPAAGTVLGTLSTTTGTVVVDQVQVELNTVSITSPIPTTTGTVTRAADDCSATHTLPVNDFSLTFVFNSKDASTGTRYLLDARSASNEGLDVYLDSGVIYARKQLAGVPHTASKALVVANTTYKIGVRLDSTNGVDIWVDGTKGTNAANTTDTTNGSTLYFGQDISNANQGYINIKNINEYSSLSDADMTRLTT